MKKITIVICTYNGSKYIKEVLDSIIVQEKLGEHVERILIVDNASKDNTKEIIQKYELSHPIVQYIYEEKPGLSHARKHAVKAKTEWVTYLDDDNILPSNWLLSTIKFIDNHNEVGVFNSASIAEIRYEMIEKEKQVFNYIYPFLACTHKNYREYKSGYESAIKGPFGAGMTLKTEPLREYLNSGWTSNVGRKGETLSSGEDGEIARYVLNKGYKYGYNHNNYLFHIIPRSRVQPEYSDRLIEGLNKGYYNYISTNKMYIFYRLRMLVKSIVYIPYLLISSNLYKDKDKKYKSKQTLKIRIRLFNYIIRDFIVLKRNKES